MKDYAGPLLDILTIYRFVDRLAYFLLNGHGHPSLCSVQGSGFFLILDV